MGQPGHLTGTHRRRKSVRFAAAAPPIRYHFRINYLPSFPIARFAGKSTTTSPGCYGWVLGFATWDRLRGARLASTSFTFSHSFVTPRFRDKHAKIEEVCRNSENWDNAAVLTGQKVDYCLHKRIADFIFLQTAHNTIMREITSGKVKLWVCTIDFYYILMPSNKAKTFIWGVSCKERSVT